MTVLAEQLSGDRRYSYLNFEEFLLFLVHCALFWKLDWVNQDQPDEPEEEEVVPSTKKDEKKKPPARPPAKLAKASKVEEPAESSESSPEVERPSMLLSCLTGKATHKNIARAVQSLLELLVARI